LPDEGGIVKLGTTKFVDTPVVTVTNASLNFIHNTADGTGAPDTLKLGNIFGTAITGSFTDIGATSVFLDATVPTTTITDDAGVFDIGATDASLVDAHLTSELVMFLPDSGSGVAGTTFPENPFLNHGVTVAGGTDAAGANLLQGSSGPLVTTTAASSSGTAYIGGVADDTIFGGAGGGDNIFGMGGNDQIHLGTHGANDTVWIGFYHEGGSPGTNFHQAITDVVGGVEIGVNFYLGSLAAITTVSGFQLGATGDILNFGYQSWMHTGLSLGGTDFGLENNNGTANTFSGPASMELVATPGFITTGAVVTLDNIATYANAGALQAALTTGGVGNINFGNYSFPVHSLDHHLVAYGTGTGVNIADVELFNQTGSGQLVDTANPSLTVIVHDLVDLVGTASLGNLNPHNIQFA
jgi:hypothetical protein